MRVKINSVCNQAVAEIKSAWTATNTVRGAIRKMQTLGNRSKRGVLWEMKGVDKLSVDIHQSPDF